MQKVVNVFTQVVTNFSVSRIAGLTGENVTPWALEPVLFGKLFTERIEADRCDLPLLSITDDRGVGRLSHLSLALDDSEQFVIAIWHFFILIVS
jgi:hypothetical protein